MTPADAIDFLMAKSMLIAKGCWTTAAAAAWAKENEDGPTGADSPLRDLPAGKAMIDEMTREFRRVREQELKSLLRSMSSRRPMTAAEHRAFEDRWDERLDHLTPADVDLATLVEWDGELERVMRAHVPGSRRDTIRELLRGLYARVRLTTRPPRPAKPPAGWLVLLPRDPPEALTRAEVAIPPMWASAQPRLSEEAVFWQDTDRTIGQLAQRYADHAGQTVWIDPAVAARSRGRAGSVWMADAPGIARALQWKLQADGLRMRVRNDNIAVVSEVQARVAERTEPRPPEVVTAEECARARAAFSIDDCWAVVESVRVHAEDSMKLRRALRRVAKPWRADEALGFSLRMSELMNLAYTHELWGAAYVINGGSSDDGFLYFRAWLILRGRGVFEVALRDPDSLVDHVGETQDHEAEFLLYVPADIYFKVTGRPLPQVPPAESQFGSPRGQPWAEDDLPRRYPRLHARLNGAASA